MPFPKEGKEWPPEDYRAWYNKIIEWSTWYSGEPQQLLNLYSSQQFFPDTEWGRFWARIEAEERANAAQPAAGDVLNMSNLLFSEVQFHLQPESSWRGPDRDVYQREWDA